MIHVNRSRVEEPEFLTSDKCDALRADAEKHFRNATSDSRRFQFDLRQLRRGVDATLDALFHNKCAYCEQIVAKGGPPTKMAPRPGAAARRNFEHFRPKRGAIGMGTEGESSPLHYWWLFYEWNNLFLACQTCNTNKRTQFPLAGPRAPGETPWASIEERRLLLDPCVDEPSEYLVFTETGDVRAEPIDKFRHGWEGDRARVTIEVLGLNRMDLVQARLQLASEFAKRLRGYRHTPGWTEHVRRRLADDAPFSALHRQIFARWTLDENPGPEQVQWLEETCPQLLTAEQERAMRTPIVLESLGVEPLEATPFEAMVGAEESVPELSSTGFSIEIEDEPMPAPVPESVVTEHALSATIQRLSLQNFKAIRELKDIVMPAAPQEPVTEIAGSEAPETQLGWLSFLGENGAGKSSILQAIALALAGPRIRSDRTLKPHTRFIRRRDAADPAGAEISAVVKLELSNLSEPLCLEITESGGFQFPDSWKNPGVFVRAYGATRFPARHVPDEDAQNRLGPKTSLTATDTPPLIEYRNLFDPFMPLVDVKRWLKSLTHDETLCNAARQAFEDLLGLGPEPDAPEPFKLRLDISPEGDLSVDEEPLENLSSGYQTLIALAADIMAGLPQRLSDMQDAGGIILLDEVGAHLHPGWKMVIVPRLRTAFPGMQFITTTHEPLCLRGHTEGEVAVVTRKKAKHRHPEDHSEPAEIFVEVFDVQLATDLPSPKNLRVDQLLTSKHFGLDSTIDPELDTSFRKYYQLLARHEHELSADQIQERNTLRDKLRGQGILGYTRRDQLIYDAIDQYIADERRIEEEERDKESNDEKKKKRRSDVMKNVIDLWRFAKRDESEHGVGS